MCAWIINLSSSAPPPPQDLSVTVLSARQVLLQWRPHIRVVITGLALTYRVSVSGRTNATPNTSILLDSLSPTSSYTFSVWACFSAINDNCVRYNSVSMRKTMPEDGKPNYPKVCTVYTHKNIHLTFNN